MNLISIHLSEIMTSYINHFVSQTNVYINLRMFIVVLENKIKILNMKIMFISSMVP